MRAVPRVWMRYLLRAGSITNSRDPSRNREIITVLGIVREDYRRQSAEERYRDELELAAIKHQLLAATVRVNGIDRRSPLQAELLADMEENWPRWRENPYLPGLPARHRLLLKLIGARRWGAVHALMRANALVKRKKT